ncbi:stAR-related lipid transfer protein 9 isoform X2 [Sminthopsis crassicaudata]|uniref:stAR-related lipid transfer protein 9 isoform X2 n=1 Tax=Sminthopsis crassicaudata TaxID=9301 RepID=UPI003D68415A
MPTLSLLKGWVEVNRETANRGRIIIEIEDKVAKIKNLKVDSRPDGPGGAREKVVAFGFDYCYWSVNPEDPQYASQEVVFQDLGTEVLSGAAKGYNICLFAYGQTGSGKTYTMIGTPASLGLTPRICEGLFSKKDDYSNLPPSRRIRVSFLEIYNEKVRDLLKQSDQKKPYTLRVREHPQTGPYVQGLSQHVVTNSKQIIGLLEEGVANRITAATHVHEASSRSHAIFTIYYTEAILENNLSSEIASKINLVDLAGSERADPSYCKDRITEGASINKSLVTLGIVISTLAQNSQMFINYQSPNSTSSEGGDSGSLSSPSVAGSIGGIPRKQSYIPYRDSVLTWLLKDSLGGNSKTIMVATVSPANSSYSETMSTLRYASSAKSIINKPRVNEDANVKLIRELREEIERLKGMLLSFELGNLSPFMDGRNGNLKELVLHNEMKRDQLSKDWTQKWDDWKVLMECNVDINKKKAGVMIDSNLPHLMVLDDDVLSTGVVLYHLREGTTKIGRIDSDQEQDIVLQGQWIERDHCTITSICGVVTLQPALGARCTVNGQNVTDSCRLTQGAIIILGETQKFRFIHPAEAAALRQRRLLGEVSAGNSNCSLEWLDLDGDVTAPPLGVSSVLEEDSPFCNRRARDIVSEAYHQKHLDQAVSHRTQIRQQKRLVKDLRQDILVGQIRAEQELEFDQALINQQIKDNQRWLLREETRLASLQQHQQPQQPQEQQQQQDGTSAETDTEIFHEAESQIGPETLSTSLDGGRKRLVQLQVLWRNALWAAERKVRRKKVKFQLEKIVKKQKLLEAQKKLEQLETLSWKDNPSQLDPDLDANFSAFQKKSESSISSSSLGNHRLCGLPLSPSQSVLKCAVSAKLSTETVRCSPEKPQSGDYLFQAASVPRGSITPSNDSGPPSLWQTCEGRRASFGDDTPTERASPLMSTMPVPARDRRSQEMSRRKQPLGRLHRAPASVSRSAEQLRSRDKPDSFFLSPRNVREKPSGSYSLPRRRWRRERDLLATRGSPHPQGAKRSVVYGKIQATRLCQAAWALQQWEPGAASLARGSIWPRGRLFGVKDREQAFRENPVKREGEEGTWSAGVLRAASGSLGARSQENDDDFSDTDSTYSLDSLSCTYTRTLIKPQKQEAPEPNARCTELENSESDDSQMSQDSLVEKRKRTQRRLLPGSPLPLSPERSEVRSVASSKASLPPSDSELPWKKVRTFSLDSLNNEEEDFREESKEGPASHSSDEMPAEVFWQVKSSRSLTECQEKVLEFQASDQGPDSAGPDVTLKPSTFYLTLQPETERNNYRALQQTQNLRNSSLVSMDSWFSCDSESKSSDSQEVNLYSQMNLGIRQLEVQDMEKPMVLVEVGGLQQPAPELATEVYSCFSPLPGSGLVPRTVHGVSGKPSLDVLLEAPWRPPGPCKPGSDTAGSLKALPEEGRDLASLIGYCSPVPSNSALPSSMSAAPAALLSHKGSTLGKGRPVVEYLCEFSHSSLGATVRSTQVSSSSQKDTSYLPFTSGKKWDSFFPVCPKMPGDFDFNDASSSLSSTRQLRTEQEQNGGSLELDDLSTLFRTIEKDAHRSCTSADLEAGDPGLENAWVFAAENKVSASGAQAHPAHQGIPKQSQPMACRRVGSAVPFDESFFLRDISNSSSPMNAKEELGPPAWTQREENLPGRLVPLKLNNPLSQPAMKTELLQNTSEQIDRERSFSLALATDSEPSWAPFPSPERLHPVETFYMLESRDALTETALEIPACREWGEEMPSTSRGEELNAFQFLRNVDSDLLLLLRTPSPKNPSSQQVAGERSFSPGNRKDLSGTEVPKSMEKFSNPIAFSAAQNRLLLESISMAACQLGKPGGILNNQHPQSTLKMKEQDPDQPPWGVPFSDSGAVISSIEGDHKHRESENDIRGNRGGYLLGVGTADFEGQIHSGPNSNFLYKTDGSNQAQHRVNMQENALISKKRSSSNHSGCTSPAITSKDETSPHLKEGTESVSLGMALHPKDCPEESVTQRRDPPYGKDSASNPTLSTKEEGPIASKEPENLMVIPNSQGDGSQKRSQTSSQGKIVNHSEEMARLISSVSQLESSIMEIDSRQKYHPCALYMAEAYRRAMCRDRKEHGKTHLTLRPNDFREILCHRDQPHSPKKIQEEEVPNNIEVRGIKKVNSCIQESYQNQKMTPTLPRLTEVTEEDKTEREHTPLSAPELSVRCPSDYLFLRFSQRCTAQKKTASAPGSPEGVESLVRTESTRAKEERAKEERSEGSRNEESASELNPQSHTTLGTGSFPKLEPKATFQESQTAENLTSTVITAKCKEVRVHDIDQETNTLRGKSMPTGTYPAPLTQGLPGVSQILHTGRYRTQETAHPWPSQEGYPAASTKEGNIFFSDSPKLSEKYFRSTMKAVSLSSADSEPDLEFLKTQAPTPSESREEQQKINGEAKNHSSLRSVSCKNSFVEQSVWQSFSLRTVSGLCYQPSGAGSSPGEASNDSYSMEEMKASATAVLLEQQGEDTRITPRDLNLGNSSLTEAELTLLRNIKRASSLIQCPLEKRASHQWADRELQVPQAVEKNLWRTEDFAMDLSTTSTSLSATNEGKRGSSLGAWGVTVAPSMHPKMNVETTEENTKLSQECGKSSEDSANEQIIMPKLTRDSSRFWGASAIPSMYPEMNVETTVENNKLSEECEKSSKDSTSEQIISPELTKVSSGFWGASATSSTCPKMKVETTVNNNKLSKECEKSSKDSTSEQIISPELTKVSSGFWGASATPSTCPKMKVETTVNNNKLSKECEKSSKNSTDEQIIAPELTRISSGFWGSSTIPSVYPKMKVETTLENNILSEECEKSSNDNINEQIIASELTRVSSGFWGASATPSMYPKMKVETTVENNILSEECEKSSRDRLNEQIIASELTRVSSGFLGASATPIMHPKMNVETTVENNKLSEECKKFSKDNVDEQIIAPELTRAASGFWVASTTPSVYPKMNVEITVENNKLSQECGKSPQDSANEQIIVPKLTGLSSGFWGASAPPSMYPKVNVETPVENNKLSSEECEKSSKDNTDEQIIVSKLTGISSGFWGASTTPKMNIETTVESNILSEECRKCSKGSTDKQVIVSELTKVLSAFWEASTPPSTYSKMNVEPTGEDNKPSSEECKKGSKDCTDEQIIMPELIRVSSGFWGASATPSIYPEANVETTVEDTRLTEECENSSKDSTDEQIIGPELTRASSGFWGASATPSVYSKMKVETTMENNKLSEECKKCSKDDTDEQIIVPKLAGVLSGAWGASATPSMYPKMNVETTVENTKLSSEECKKCSEDSTDEQIIMPELTRASSGFWGASATPSVYSKMKVETTGENNLSEEYKKCSKDSTEKQIIMSHSESLLELEAFSGNPKQSPYNQRDQLELARTHKEDESQVCFVQNQAAKGHLQGASPGIASGKRPDQNCPLAKVYQTESLQLRKDSTAPGRGPEHALPLSFSTMANPGSKVQTAGEKPTGHLGPQALPESPDRKEEMMNSFSVGVLASGNMLSSSALEDNCEEPARLAPSFHGISNNIRLIQQELSQALLCKQTEAHSEVERTSLGSKESIQRVWEEFRSQSIAYGNLSGADSSEAVVEPQTHWGTPIQSPWKDAPFQVGSATSAVEMSYALADSTTPGPVFVPQGSFHIRKQPIISWEAEMIEAEDSPYLDSPLAASDIKQSRSLPAHPRCVPSPGLGERRASHNQDPAGSGTVEGGRTGGALPQCPKLKGVTLSGQSLPYGAGNGCPRPTSLLDQRLVEEMEESPEGSLVQSNVEVSKSTIMFSPLTSQGEAVTSPSRPSCMSPQGVAFIDSPSFTKSLSYGNSDPEKRIPRSSSDTMLPVFLTPSKLTVGHQSRGPNVPLAHSLDLRESQQELRLAASNTGLCGMESPGSEDVKKTSSSARTYSEKLERLQEEHEASQNEWEFPPGAEEPGSHVKIGRLEAMHVSEDILENEATIGFPHLAQGPPFPKDSRDPSIPIPHPRTKTGKKCIFSNLPGNVWKTDENENLSNNTVWDRNHHHLGTSGQVSPQGPRGSPRTDGRASRPERLRLLSETNNGPFDHQEPCPLSEGSQDDLDTGSHDRDVAPCAAFSCSPGHSPKDFSLLKASIGTSSKSPQELNMSVEPPSPTEEDECHGTERLYLNDLSPDESEMMSVELGKCPGPADCGQTAPPDYSLEAPGPQSPAPGTPPYPTSSTLLTMPVPEGRTADVPEEEQHDPLRDKGWVTLENMDAMQGTSGRINPFVQSWQQEGPGRIGWKQYMLGSASDTSCNQISWSLDSLRAVRCSSVDDGLDTSSSPYHSQLSSCANPHELSSPSSIEDPRGLEERKRSKTSSVFRSHHGFSDTSLTVPSSGIPDKVGEGPPEDECALIEQREVSGNMGDLAPLYPTKSSPKADTATCEQGTMTLTPTQLQQVHMHCQVCVDVPHPSHPPPATWKSMHNLSMHLSQLLHNTSELLGNLSHQGTPERERGVKAEAPEEAPKAVTMDSSTQTTVDVGIQTDEMDPAPQDVSLHSSGDQLANPQEANVATLKHSSLDGMDALDTPQEVEHSPVLQEKENKGTAETKETSSSSTSQKECSFSQDSLDISRHSLSFQEHSLSQEVVSLQASSAASPSSSSHKLGSSCTAVTSPTSCTASSLRDSSPQEGESACESSTQKNKKAGYRNTLLVDRASSPILTFSASAQGPHSSSSSTSSSSSSSSSSSNPPCLGSSHFHSTILHQKLRAGRVSSAHNFSQASNEGETGNISEDSAKSMGKKLSKGSFASNSTGALKPSLWLHGSSSSTSTGFLSSPQQLQVRASLGLLGWEEQLAGEKKKKNSWERPLYLSLPTTGLSPTEGQSEASNTSSFVAEGAAEGVNPVSVQLASPSTSWCQKRASTGADSSEQLLKSPPPSETPFWGRVVNHCHGPSSISEISVAPGHGSIARDTQSEVLLTSCTQKVQTADPKKYNLKDLPVHNKFSNWCGVQGSSPQGTMTAEGAVNADNSSSEGLQEKSAQLSKHLSQVPEQLQREQVQVLAGVPLELGPQTPPLSVELAEAKLLYGLGETDALLRVMQSGTGEALVPDAPRSSQKEEMYFRRLKTIEVMRRERSDRLQNFRRARSLSPMKQLGLLPTPEAFPRDPDLPSRRREYLQQLRKDVVETTRNLESASDTTSHQPSDIEVLLRDYQRAREETKMEIARARDRLRERAEQEKQRIRQQIVSQLQREEAKLQTLVSVSTLCTTSSMDSRSSSPTSGYDSSNLTLASQSQPPEKQGNANIPCFKETTGGDLRGRSAVRNYQLYLNRPAQKNLGHQLRGKSHRASFDRPHKSLISQSNSDSCLSTSPGILYHDLVKHILTSTMSEVMAACSDNLQNLFSCQATAGWKYQGEEKDVLTYYKGFPSATRHGFLGAGVVPQPLPRVWAAVRDPTTWTLYDKSIQTAQLYHKVTNTIKLVYLVSSTSINCLKQPRDFCCVSAEAKEGHLTIMVAQSVYDKSMPRPSGNMIRGEILPSAWLLQPHTVDGKEVTKVIHMVQVELGAPGLPPGLLTHCAKQQPLVIANLASFLCG